MGSAVSGLIGPVAGLVGGAVGEGQARKDATKAKQLTLSQIEKAVAAISQWSGPGGFGEQNLEKTQGFISSGFDKGIGAASAIGESNRRDIKERGAQRTAGIDADLTSRGLGGSSLGVQASALSGSVESAELDNLAGSLANTFSALEVGRGSAMANAQSHYSDSMLNAQQAIGALHGGVSFQGGSGGGLGSAIGQLGMMAALGGKTGGGGSASAVGGGGSILGPSF